MSRNFELMTRIERELGATHDRIRTAADRPVAKSVLPEGAGDIGGKAISRLVHNVFLSARGSAPRQVIFCGVDLENGSSSVCARVGKTLAATDSGSICLIDANFRSPRLAGLLGVDTAAAFLRKPASVREPCFEISDNLWLAGHDFLADGRDVLPSATRLKQLLAELRGAFDFLLIDAPGAGASGDAAILGQVAEGTILVIEANTTRRLSARRAKEALDAANVRLLGTVLHDRSFPIPEWIYRRL